HRETRAWNWNPYLFVAWAVGVGFRYLVLLPLRLVGLLVGSVVFLVSFGVVFTAVKQGAARDRLLRRLLQFWCSVFIMSWSGVVQYHGELPKRTANQIYVSNHTSMIDIIVLIQSRCFAIVGQQHGGWVGWVQNNVLGPLGGLWFNRTQANDRLRVSRTIKEHIAEPGNNPLLLFPEGTCVNNEYSVMFKKGAFELGAVVCPIAIKYDREWADAFWNSRRDPFWLHLVHLMCCWAVVCDVYFMKPVSQRPKESSAAFAQRVKDKICRKIGLKDVPWDGYLKHVQLKEGFKELRQQIYARQLLNRIEQQSDLTNREVTLLRSLPTDSTHHMRRINSAHQIRSLVAHPSSSDEEDTHHHHQQQQHSHTELERIRSIRSSGNFAQLTKKLK
ncbi:MAG: 1-acyl-sn-glycerol-3-phosphate acyltransferase, partial [archaeon]|nr:1-acyl-sn-glycerol-3-phosphate acyltransferase [archaeon]